MPPSPRQTFFAVNADVEMASAVEAIDWQTYETLAAESRVAQGLPAKVVCPVALSQLASIIKAAS